jgi:hypothetical protein
MDSPFTSPFFYQNNFILPEKAIFSSQPTLTLLNIEDEKMQKAPELSVVVIDKEQKEETSDRRHQKKESQHYQRTMVTRRLGWMT